MQWATLLCTVRRQSKLFVRPESLGAFFKPQPALRMNHCHRLWAAEDASGEDDDDDGLRFGCIFLYF